jgi:DNA-binding transcriptional ArsR family regulator
MAATEIKPMLDVLTLDKPEQLKALGHPLRLRVLETLGAKDTEQMTNRELAGRLGVDRTRSQLVLGSRLRVVPHTFVAYRDDHSGSAE